MHILLTDTLCCPRCGPEFGLILLAHRVEERRILEGELGCPNCRASYPVRRGFGDLRAPPRESLPPLPAERAREPRPAADEPPPPGGDEPSPSAGGEPPDPAEAPNVPEEVLRLGALLGVERGPGRLVLVGDPARHARALADMLEEIEVVAVDASLRAEPEWAGVTRIVAAPRLPFFSGTVRGVALGGNAAPDLLDEAVRIVQPGGRVVVLDPPDGVRARLEEGGLGLLLDEAGTVVALRG